MTAQNQSNSSRVPIELYFDKKNYTDEQAQSLVQAFEDHDYDVAVREEFRKSADLLPAVITLVAGLPLGKIVELFFEQAYDAWLRPAFAKTLFRPHNTKEAPRFEIEGSNVHVYVVATDEVEFDHAVGQLKGLADVLASSDLIIDATPRTLRLDYRNGAWTIHADHMSKSYDYEHGSRKLLEQGKR